MSALRVQIGKHILVLSFSGFDPYRKSASSLLAARKIHISKVIGSLISGPVNEAAIGRRTPGSTATS
jgi:hypothetical protein